MPYLYHSSSVQDLKTLEPKKRYTPQGKISYEAIYASPLPAFSAAHAWDWSSADGVELGVYDGKKVVLTIPVHMKGKSKVPISIYKINAEGFRHTIEEGTGFTWDIQTSVDIIEEQKFSSVEEAVTALGGEVVYTQNLHDLPYFHKGNNSITDQYYTDQDFVDLLHVKTFAEVYSITHRVIEHMPKGLIQVCGPISSGGVGSIEGNIARMDSVIKKLQGEGWNIFDQMYVEGAFQHIRYSPEYEHKDGHGDILNDFYLPLFKSRKIKGLYFMKDWQSSKGAQWEHDKGVELGLEIYYE